MRALLKRLFAADRPRIVAVVGMTRDEVERGVAHILLGGGSLPVWAWCAEVADGVPGCARFVSGASARQVRQGLRGVWPALSVVAWTGEGGHNALKLIPLLIPPFRVVAFNEAGGFFGVRPAALANHVFRRFRDAFVSDAQRVVDWIGGLRMWGDSIRVRFAQRSTDVWNLICACCLAVLAALTEWTPPLARWVAGRLAPGVATPMAVKTPAGTSFLEVEIPHRGWPRRAILKAARDSKVDFLVLRRRGDRAPVEPLLALAREANAFAAARQIAWSGWRKVIVARHPFRALQPGEVTEVAAPYSSLLVIRRDLLIGFGVPHALTFGAALMILFRKAAAAGLRSVVSGYGEAITQEPGTALEDAEFVSHVVLSRQLRQLAPAHPARTRGNLAWSQLMRRNFRAKPRVLIVSPYLPYPLSHGGAVRIYNLCRSLSNEIDFVLACFREANETVCYSELHQVFREVYTVDSDEKQPNAGIPAQAADYRNTAMADLIERLCTARDVDLVQLEFTQMAEFRAYAGDLPVILVEHDLTFQLHRQFAESVPNVGTRRQYELWLAFEREALANVRSVWTMSEQDRSTAIEHGAKWQRTAVVGNGVDLQWFRPAPRTTAEQTILFIGSFRHSPNLLAFEAMVEEVMPLVWESCPDAKLHVIAGPNHINLLKAAGKLRLLGVDPRIVVEGFVEDVRPAYRECDVVVVPLPVSAGTNIKLMEAMASGRAVVCTPVGCRGLDLRDSSDLLIREIGPEFAGAITLLLWDEALRLRMAGRARETAERRFDWNEIAQAALGSYGALLREPFAEEAYSSKKWAMVRIPSK